MAKVILYHGLASTCSKKVRLCLYEKGVPFESRLLDLQKREQRDPAYLELNPNGVVPTLVHGGTPVIESSIIMEYIDETFAEPPLSPATPDARARMRLWLRFSDMIAYPSIAAPTWDYMRRRAAGRQAAEKAQAVAVRADDVTRVLNETAAQAPPPLYSDAQLAEATNKMADCISRIESALATSPWLVGENYTLADAAVLPFAVRIRNLRPDLVDASRQPAITSWLARAAERPAFVRAMDFTDDPRAAGLVNV